MSLPHAILGILRAEAMTGYDLKTRCFDRSLAHFWPADQAQIYRTLERLHHRGWVNVRVHEQTDRPARKVYATTSAGEAELERWIADERFAAPTIREPSLIQIFFADRQPPAVVHEIIEALRRQYQERLATYTAIRLPQLEADAPRNETLQRMTLEMGIHHAKAMVAWADACLARNAEAMAQAARSDRG